jgi:hypothetical protein
MEFPLHRGWWWSLIWYRATLRRQGVKFDRIRIKRLRRRITITYGGAAVTLNYRIVGERREEPSLELYEHYFRGIHFFEWKKERVLTAERVNQRLERS